MRAIVVGASGHIGNAVTRALLQRGYEVTACGRRSTPPVNLAGLPIAYSPGDADDSHQFEKWIAGHDLVVDAAAPYPIGTFSPLLDASTNHLGAAERRTRHLVEAVSRHGARLIYIGSFVTLAKPVTAAQRLRAQMLRLTHPYFSVKDLIDSQLVEAARHGLRAIIACPSYCLGPWDLRDPELCTIPMLMRGRVPAAITANLNVIDVRDVAEAALAALDQEQYGTPLLMSAHATSVRDLYWTVCDLGGVECPTMPMSRDFAILGTYWSEMMLGLVNRKPTLPSAGMAMSAEFDYLQRECAIRDFGIEPRPLRETVSDALEWYRQIGYC